MEKIKKGQLVLVFMGNAIFMAKYSYSQLGKHVIYPIAEGMHGSYAVSPANVYPVSKKFNFKTVVNMVAAALRLAVMREEKS